MKAWNIVYCINVLQNKKNLKKTADTALKKKTSETNQQI